LGFMVFSFYFLCDIYELPNIVRHSAAYLGWVESSTNAT
jgi:hypothetical protein